MTKSLKAIDVFGIGRIKKDIAAGIPQAIIDEIVHAQLNVVTPKSGVDHLAAAICADYRAEAAEARGDGQALAEINREVDAELDQIGG